MQRGCAGLADPRGLAERVARLEAEVAELPALNQRLAELTESSRSCCCRSPTRRRDHRRGARAVHRRAGVVSRRVFLHIGLPKTGTSYLQSVLWPHRGSCGAGLLLPGRAQRDHLLASMVVREDPNAAAGAAPGRSGRGTACARRSGRLAGDALVSHEFFCAASAEQADADGRATFLRPRCRSWSPPGSRSGCSPPAGRSPEEHRHHPARRLRRAVSEDATRGLELAAPSTSAWVLERWGAAVPARAGPRDHAAPGRTRRAKSCGGGSARCSGVDPDGAPERRRSRTSPWGWWRPRRCAG